MTLPRVPHRRQLHQPRPVCEPACRPTGHLIGQPGLPRPPGPVTVTSRYRASSSAASRSGLSRPMKLVSTAGKPCTPPAAATEDSPTSVPEPQAAAAA